MKTNNTTYIVNLILQLIILGICLTGLKLILNISLLSGVAVILALGYGISTLDNIFDIFKKMSRNNTEKTE